MGWLEDTWDKEGGLNGDEDEGGAGGGGGGCGGGGGGTRKPLDVSMAETSPGKERGGLLQVKMCNFRCVEDVKPSLYVIMRGV